MNPHFHLGQKKKKKNLAISVLLSLYWFKMQSLWGSSTIYSEFFLFQTPFCLWVVTEFFGGGGGEGHGQLKPHLGLQGEPGLLLLHHSLPWSRHHTKALQTSADITAHRQGLFSMLVCSALSQSPLRTWRL